MIIKKGIVFLQFLFSIFFVYLINMSLFKLKKKNPVCVVYWRDAAYSYQKKLPSQNPPLQVTSGFVVVSADAFTNIAVNVNYNQKDDTLWPVDGFVIPEKAIIKFKRIGWLV